MTGVRKGKDVDKRSLRKGEGKKNRGSRTVRKDDLQDHLLGKKKTSKRRTTVFLPDNEKDAATKKQICQELNCNLNCADCPIAVVLLFKL